MDPAQPAPSPFVEVPNPIPFNAWAVTSNALFYRNVSNPLGAFRTLGSVDPLLPRAFAGYLERSGATSVQEIGPGNFSFAKRVLQYAPGISEYNAFDLSDSSYNYHRDSLPPGLMFRNVPANRVRSTLEAGNTQIVGVELCDDLPNEFWTSANGKLYELWMNLGVHRALSKETLAPRDLPGVLPVRSELSNDIDAAQLSEIIGSGKWDRLAGYNPGILKAIQYTNRQFIASDLSRIFETSWSTAPGEFRPFGERILDLYRSQLLAIEKPGEVVHLPAAAILLLWQFRDLPQTTVHFFDYGYDSISNLPGAYSLYQGQITAPVNFRLLKEAASILGYDATVRKDREFIQEQTGEDAMSIARLQGLGLERLAPEVRGLIELELFGRAASELCPDAAIDPGTITGLRIRAADARRVAVELGRELSYRDGSFHFIGKTPGSSRGSPL